VVPRPLGDDGEPGEYPRGWRAGGSYKITCPDGVQEWTLLSWRALVRWRDVDGRLHMVRKWARTRTRAAEEARAEAVRQLEADQAARDAADPAGTAADREAAAGDVTTTVNDLVDAVMTEHVPSLSERTQEEYVRIRIHMNDPALPPMLGELPRSIDAGAARAWIEAFVHAHGASSAARAKALLAKALDRATESKQLRTPVNPIRAVPGAINPKARRRTGKLTKDAPSDDAVADLLARLAADPLAGLPSGPRRKAPAGQAGLQPGNPLDVADIILISFLAGLRVGEITALRWQDLTLTPGHGAISVTGTIATVKVRRDESGRKVPGTGTHRRHGTKSPAGIRVVPIPDDVVARLLARAEALGVDPSSLDDRARPVFPSPGKRGPDGKPPADAWRDQSNVAAAIRAAYDRHGWPWASSHTGRRWRATSLLERGYGARQVAELLGHESPKTTWQYARPRGAEALRAGLGVVRP